MKVNEEAELNRILANYKAKDNLKIHIIDASLVISHDLYSYKICLNYRDR